MSVSAIDLTAIDRRARHMPFAPRRRVSLPLHGRMPTPAEAMQGMGAGGDNPYPEGECTWGVWQLVHDQLGVSMPNFAGNATDWGRDLDQWGAQKMSGPAVNAICVWSSSKYPPFGHVALITELSPNIAQATTGLATTILHVPGDVRSGLEGPVPFTVKEMNFHAWNVFDTRVAQPGADQQGIEGFWVPKGVTAGAAASIGTPAAPTDPWAEFTGALAQVEQDAQQQVTGLARRVGGVLQIGMGLGVMGGGVVLTAMALRSEGRATMAAQSAIGRVRGFTRRQAIPAAQDVVLGPAPAPAAGAPAPGRVTAAGRTRILARVVR